MHHASRTWQPDASSPSLCHPIGNVSPRLIASQHPRRTLQAKEPQVFKPCRCHQPPVCLPLQLGPPMEGDPPGSSSPSHHSSTYRVEPPSTLEPALQSAG